MTDKGKHRPTETYRDIDSEGLEMRGPRDRKRQAMTNKHRQRHVQ